MTTPIPVQSDLACPHCDSRDGYRSLSKRESRALTLRFAWGAYVYALVRLKDPKDLLDGTAAKGSEVACAACSRPLRICPHCDTAHRVVGRLGPITCRACTARFH